MSLHSLSTLSLSQSESVCGHSYSAYSLPTASNLDSRSVRPANNNNNNNSSLKDVLQLHQKAPLGVWASQRQQIQGGLLFYICSGTRHGDMGEEIENIAVSPCLVVSEDASPKELSREETVTRKRKRVRGQHST
eukprot:CAMPEP_0175857090 /NCGR_PEP_ID=MMETSP0107_2-20121207/28901_1 /TAXON_ID=195067 ORGANISM="Goniomonas pacifica, Strain CCMP1869" /NCGR_SAMPLE_ID=MMETSP0107_2 /ASSEMBLY_ACC=CAM_ASM_000203 /LENGTH=133 /DNA_ID=CAMNT_0017173349 /DNA_START=9 /DNA_END=410 /DNA_ORIENTATION=+